MLDPQLLFLLLMLGLLFLMFSRSRKQQKAQQQLLGSLGPGAHVMTSSGLYGTVVAVEGDDMVLEVASGVRMRWTRRAVARVVDAPGTAPIAGAAGLDLTKGAGSPTGEDRPQP
ncbi:hypothetical protein NUM3379_05370 [Kineococcus sp. NUM-3379]